MVVGDKQKFVSALIVPSIASLKTHCERNDIPWTTTEAILEIPAVLAFYQEICDKLNPAFSHIEQIKRFRLLPEEWTIENEALTPTLKLKRRVILERHKKEIEGIYDC